MNNNPKFTPSYLPLITLEFLNRPHDAFQGHTLKGLRLPTEFVPNLPISENIVQVEIGAAPSYWPWEIHVVSLAYLCELGRFGNYMFLNSNRTPGATDAREYVKMAFTGRKEWGLEGFNETAQRIIADAWPREEIHLSRRRSLSPTDLERVKDKGRAILQARPAALAHVKRQGEGWQGEGLLSKEQLVAYLENLAALSWAHDAIFGLILDA